MKTDICEFFSVFFVTFMICHNLVFFSSVQSQIYFYSLAFQVRTVNIFIINMKHWFVVFLIGGNISNFRMFHSYGDNEALRKYDFSKVLSIMYIFLIILHITHAHTCWVRYENWTWCTKMKFHWQFCTSCVMNLFHISLHLLVGLLMFLGSFPEEYW